MGIWYGASDEKSSTIYRIMSRPFDAYFKYSRASDYSWSNQLTNEFREQKAHFKSQESASYSGESRWKYKTYFTS